MVRPSNVTHADSGEGAAGDLAQREDEEALGKQPHRRLLRRMKLGFMFGVRWLTSGVSGSSENCPPV